MKDETYVFIQDLKEKKTIGRGSFNKRTHDGGSGKKKWKAELMSNKELAKMNGELKAYRLNDPMTWAEFKALPDDIKKMYIKGIRERFNPFDNALAQMMGIHYTSLSVELKRLGLNQGQNGERKKWDEEGFKAWVSGEKAVEITEEEVTEVTEVTEETEAVEEQKAENTEKKKAVPMQGSLKFEGKSEDILEALASVFCGADIRITVIWETKDGVET